MVYLELEYQTVSEVEVWTGVINPDRDDMSVAEANFVLRWSFDDCAKLKMDEMANRNNRGELSEAECEELEAYANVGQVIAILQAKARLALKRSVGNGTD